MHTVRHLMGALALLTCLTACDRSDPPPPAAVAPPRASVSARPVDHLTPGELAQGNLDAFGLKLPRVMRIKYRGPTEVEAEGFVASERVANYVRARIKANSVELGAARTVFDQARVPGEKIDRPLRIEVVAKGEMTRLIVRDLSPRKPDPPMTPEERWKRHGFDKDGKLIDPNKTM